jgi:VWFA-related protein
MTRRVSITLLLSLWLSPLLPLHGQQPSPSPAPQTAPQLDSQDVVRITTSLVQVDVVVTKEGKLVTDLKPEDFEIFEDGKPQTITNFSYVSNVRANLPAITETRAKDKTALPVPPAKINLDDQRRTVAFVIDDLGMSWESVVRVRMQVKKFLAELSPNDLVAIIRTGGDAGALQQFTNDQRLLQSAVDHLRWNPCSRTGLYVFQPHGQPGPNASICSMFGLSTTLNSLKFIVRGMSFLPGRKSMILFSDSIPIEDEESFGQFPGNNTGTPPDPNQTPEPGDSYYAQLQLVAELAIRGSVVIYSADSRGLQYTGLTAADRLTSSGQAGINNEINALMSNRSRQLWIGREGSDLIARQTGGFLVRNSNDFGVKQVMEDQRGYYLIGFRPSEDTFNHEFHRIKAKLKRGGLAIRTRTGFYGFTNEEAKPSKFDAADRMNKALVSPFSPNDVNVRLTSLFVNDPAAGPLVRSFVYLDPHDLTFREQADGVRTTHLDMRAVLFGDNGRVMGQHEQNGSLRLNPADYERAMREGLAYSFEVPLKLRGAYQFRVAVRDAISSRIGAAGQFVEIPNLKDGQLALSGIVARIDPSVGQRDLSELTTPTGLIATGPAVRQFPQGSTVKFAFAVYNASVEGRLAQLTAQVRILRDGKIAFTGDPTPINFQGQTDLQHLISAAHFQIDSSISPGDYVFQIIVTDSAKQKPRVATQWIDFEVVK